MEKSRLKISVISIGGAGTEMINRIIETNKNENIDFITISTSQQDIYRSNANSKLLVGEKIARGLGCFADINIAEKAVNESKKEIMEFLQKRLKDTNIVFIVTGIGGGFGTGATPMIADIIRKMQIITICVVGLPFSFEGKKRAEQANRGKEKIGKNVDLLRAIKIEKTSSKDKVSIGITDIFKYLEECVRRNVQELINYFLSYDFESLNYEYLKKFIKESLANELNIKIVIEL